MPLVEGQRVQYTMRRGRNTIVKWFNLPWLARGSNISSIYHRQAVRYTMGRVKISDRGFYIPWVGDQYTMDRVFIGRRFDMSLVRGSTYHKQRVQYTMGKGSIYHG
jgi:hypothetical protein